MPTRLISSNFRYYIRRDSEDELWRIEDRVSGKAIADDSGAQLGFVDSCDAESWIETHEVPGWGARKAKS